MEKSITIQIPEGHEIDKERSTFEKIVFKPINKTVDDSKPIQSSASGHFYYSSDGNVYST